MSPYENSLTDEEIRELGYERTRKGWVRVDAAEEHRRTGLTPSQWRRFSFVTARGWAALAARPDSGAAAFGLATCLGKMMNREGTFDRIRSVGDALCVVVRPTVRDRVLALLADPDEQPDTPERMWRKYVTGWIEAGMAHRCPNQPRGTVTLFFEPQPDGCPACQRTQEFGRPDRGVRISGPRSPQSVPIRGDALRDGKGGAEDE